MRKQYMECKRQFDTTYDEYAIQTQKSIRSSRRIHIHAKTCTHEYTFRTQTRSRWDIKHHFQQTCYFGAAAVRPVQRRSRQKIGRRSFVTFSTSVVSCGRRRQRIDQRSLDRLARSPSGLLFSVSVTPPFGTVGRVPRIGTIRLFFDGKSRHATVERFRLIHFSSWNFCRILQSVSRTHQACGLATSNKIHKMIYWKTRN